MKSFHNRKFSCTDIFKDIKYIILLLIYFVVDTTIIYMIAVDSTKEKIQTAYVVGNLVEAWLRFQSSSDMMANY